MMVHIGVEILSRVTTVELIDENKDILREYYITDKPSWRPEEFLCITPN